MAPLLLTLRRMPARRTPSLGHYEALGIAPRASAKDVELAFEGWRRRRDAGKAGLEAFNRAEAAYHVLASPAARERHDRQLGLRPHPAWGRSGARAARACTHLAIRCLEGGRTWRARELLQRAVGLAPTDARAHSYLAVALTRTGGCLHAAARHGERAVLLSPQEPTYLFNLAEVYAAAGLTARMLAARARGWRATAVSLLRTPAKKM